MIAPNNGLLPLNIFTSLFFLLFEIILEILIFASRYDKKWSEYDFLSSNEKQTHENIYSVPCVLLTKSDTV